MKNWFYVMFSFSVHTMKIYSPQRDSEILFGGIRVKLACPVLLTNNIFN